MVVPHQLLDQLRHASYFEAVPLERRVAEAADLPQKDVAVWVDAACVHEEIRSLEGLASNDRINTEIGKQAVLSRNRGQHARLVPFGSSTANRFVCGRHKNARMPINSETHFLSCTHILEYTIHHFAIGDTSVLVLPVEV